MNGSDAENGSTKPDSDPWAGAKPKTKSDVEPKLSPREGERKRAGRDQPSSPSIEGRSFERAPRAQRPSGGGEPNRKQSDSGSWSRSAGGSGSPSRGPRQFRKREEQATSTQSPVSGTPADATAVLAEGLIRELASRVQRHPSGRLVQASRETVPLTLEVPIARGKDRLDTFQQELSRALEAAVLSLVSEREISESGRAYCLRCGSSDCEHSPPEPRQVFVGYGASGVPQFEDYSQALLNLGDPGMSQLFGGSGRLVTRLWSEQELTHRLLPAFGETESGFRLLGQVTAGWFWVPAGYDGGNEEVEQQLLDNGRNFALTFQIAVIAVKGQPRRLVLNTIGVSPAGGSLEDLHDAFGELPWESARRWCRGALRDVERMLRQARPKKQKSAADESQPLEVWHERTLRILAGFERRLLRRERSTKRKTMHAEKRRKQKRPTGHALSDLASANDEAVMQDTRNGTFVVLGEKGRTHIFNEKGKLVTSIVYGAETVERRKEKGFWVAAPQDTVADFRESVAVGGG